MDTLKRFKPAPANAESIAKHTYTRQLPPTPSRYIDGLMIPSGYVMRCPDPACAVEQPDPQHGEHGGCISCSLRWVAFGNSLNIWRDRPKKVHVV